MAYRMAGNDADAKDLAQEAFLRVFRAWRSIDPSAHLDSWLYRIVTNLFIDMLRRRPRVRMESLDAPVTARSGGEMVREIADDRARRSRRGTDPSGGVRGLPGGTITAAARKVPPAAVA